MAFLFGKYLRRQSISFSLKHWDILKIKMCSFGYFEPISMFIIKLMVGQCTFRIWCHVTNSGEFIESKMRIYISSPKCKVPGWKDYTHHTINVMSGVLPSPRLPSPPLSLRTLMGSARPDAHSGSITVSPVCGAAQPAAWARCL